jgi:hypothetical protein
MSRYETFLIRLWIGDDDAMNHGEVKHLGSGTGSRFREVHNATAFIEETMRMQIADRKEARQDSQEDGLLDFGRMASR